MSGTSMATPLVAGAVALLWSAVPAARGQISMTEQILNNSAAHIASSDCSSSGWPNNTYGYGRLDVRAAYALALPYQLRLPLLLVAPAALFERR
jgi:subtilisin family serine protease